MPENNFTDKNFKNIQCAKFAGFCYGVKRAVETVKKLKKENPDKQIFVLGELIHNTHVISELENLGIKTINEIPEKAEGICVIRTHGESPQVIEKIKIKMGGVVPSLTANIAVAFRQPFNELERSHTLRVALHTIVATGTVRLIEG